MTSDTESSATDEPDGGATVSGPEARAGTDFDTGPDPSYAARARRLYATTVDAWQRFPLTRMASAVPETAGFILRSFTRRDRTNFEGEPVPVLTPGITLGVAMDEAMLALAKGPSRFPRREQYERVGDEIAAAYALFGARGWLDDPSAYHVDPPPLADPAIERASWLGPRYERLAFHSGYEPHPDEPGRDRWLRYEHNKTAHAWLLRHPDTDGADRPWLVCIHGFAMGTPIVDFTAFRAKELHALGINVAIAVLPLHGPRRVSKLSGDALMDLDSMNTIHGAAQALWDTRRLLSWIRTQRPSAIGVYGMSFGAYVAGLLATKEPLDLMIAGVPFADLPELFRRHSPRHVVKEAKSYGILGRRLNELSNVVSPLAAPSRVPGPASYIFAGLGDRMATPRQAYMLARHWDGPNTLWYSGNHVGFMWSGEVQAFIRRALRDRGFGRRPTPVDLGDDADPAAASA